MPRYQYKVVPAPTKGLKAKGLKGAEARFSNALGQVMNEMATAGWEYQRAETLPSTERSRLTGSTTEWRNVLVFRQPRAHDTEAFSPELLPAPAADDPLQEPAQSPDQAEAVEASQGALASQDVVRNPATENPENITKSDP